MKNQIANRSVQLLFTFLAVATSPALACDVQATYEVIGQKMTDKESNILVRTDWQLPDSPRLPHSVRVLDIKSAKVLEEIPVKDKKDLEKLTSKFRGSGYLILTTKKPRWREIKPEITKDETFYPLEDKRGSIIPTLEPSGNDGPAKSILLIKSSDQSKTPRKITPTNVVDSASATEIPRVQGVFANSKGTYVVVLYGNCSDGFAVIPLKSH